MMDAVFLKFFKKVFSKPFLRVPKAYIITKSNNTLHYTVTSERKTIIMRKILDKMFGNKKASFFLPILFSALVYLLFLFFGSGENKNNLLITTLVATVFWIFGAFLVVYVQVRNPRCPEWFLNFFEFFAIVFFCGTSLIEVILFVASGFQTFNIGVCVGLVTYSSVSLAHNKRAK